MAVVVLTVCSIGLLSVIGRGLPKSEAEVRPQIGTGREARTSGTTGVTVTPTGHRPGYEPKDTDHWMRRRGWEQVKNNPATRGGV